jgi:hypothetical protein
MSPEPRDQVRRPGSFHLRRELRSSAAEDPRRSDYRRTLYHQSSILARPEHPSARGANGFDITAARSSNVAPLLAGQMSPDYIRAVPTIDLPRRRAGRGSSGNQARHRGRQVPPRPAPRSVAGGPGEARGGGNCQVSCRFKRALEGPAGGQSRQAGAAITGSR